MKQESRDKQPASSESQPAINKGEQHVGRANQDDTHDISHVDRQEGAMHHGELGGNFECAEDKEAETSKSSERTNK